jgi:hypothetical protein
MISLLPTTTIDLATAPTDLRKAYDGLAVLVRQSLGQDPLNGSLYVFCNRRRDRIKILFWEEGGYWFCARRLGGRHVSVAATGRSLRALPTRGTAAVVGRNRSGADAGTPRVSARGDRGGKMNRFRAAL